MSIQKYTKEVLWIFSYSKPEQFPSLILGGFIPANNLSIQKIIFTENDNPINFLEKYKPKLLITNKIKHNNLIKLLILAKEKNIRIITVYDDWSFDESTISSFRHNLNIESIKLADTSIVKTKAAADVIYKNIGFETSIIPDCLWFSSRKPIEKFRHPYEVSWFGMNTNHTTLNDILPSLENLKLKLNLKIITNKFENFKKIIENNNYSYINCEFINWTPEFDLDLLKTDIIILPYSSDNIRLVKSANRIVDSINLGRFVIMSETQQFREFEPYCYFGKISDGLEWLIKNEREALIKIAKGQDYLRDNYSNNITFKKWESAINSLI